MRFLDREAPVLPSRCNPTGQEAAWEGGGGGAAQAVSQPYPTHPLPDPSHQRPPASHWHHFFSYGITLTSQTHCWSVNLTKWVPAIKEGPQREGHSQMKRVDCIFILQTRPGWKGEGGGGVAFSKSEARGKMR